MPIAEFIQDGDAIDFVPNVDVAAGEVVLLGDLIGIAKRDIPAGVLGALALVGVYELPKATGGGTAMESGVIAFWDIGNQEVTNVSTGVNYRLLGGVVEAVGDNDATVRVRLAAFPRGDLQQPAIIALTDNTSGTPGDTLALIYDVNNPGSADLDETKDAIASLAAKVNSLIARLEAAGILNTTVSAP